MQKDSNIRKAILELLDKRDQIFTRDVAVLIDPEKSKDALNSAYGFLTSMNKAGAIVCPEPGVWSSRKDALPHRFRQAIYDGFTFRNFHFFGDFAGEFRGPIAPFDARLVDQMTPFIDKAGEPVYVNDVVATGAMRYRIAFLDAYFRMIPFSHTVVSKCSFRILREARIIGNVRESPDEDWINIGI